MIKFINWCTFYIGLWMIYNLQGILYPSGSLVSQSILALLLAISAYYVIYVNFNYRVPTFLKVLNIFLLVLTLYGGYYWASGERIFITETSDWSLISNFTYLKAIYISLFPVYAIFYFVRKKQLSERGIRIIAILLIVVATANYWQSEQSALARALELGYNSEEFTSNTGYLFLFLYPFLAFWRKNLFVFYSLLIYISYFLLIGMKRGAIVIAAFCVLYIMYKAISSSTRKQKRIVLLLCTVMLVVGVYFIKDMYDSSTYFQRRVEQTLEGNASNRENFYPKLIDYFVNQTNTAQFFVGSGANATVKVVGNYAHNDWLEIAVNQGILGIALYLAYFIALYKEVRFSRRFLPGPVYEAFLLLFFIMLMKSLFSMSYASIPIGASICLGYCLGLNMMTRKNETNSVFY